MLGLSLTCLLVACESTAEGGEAAFEDAKEARTTLADSTAISTLADSIEADHAAHTANLAHPATAHPKTKSLPDAWAQFQQGAKADIVANAATIHQLKGLPGNAKLLKRAAQIESDNTALNVAIADYLAAEQESRLNFQAKIANTLKDISARLAELKSRPQ